MQVGRRTCWLAAVSHQRRMFASPEEDDSEESQDEGESLPPPHSDKTDSHKGEVEELTAQLQKLQIQIE